MNIKLIVCNILAVSLFSGCASTDRVERDRHLGFAYTIKELVGQHKQCVESAGIPRKVIEGNFGKFYTGITDSDKGPIVKHFAIKIADKNVKYERQNKMCNEKVAKSASEVLKRVIAKYPQYAEILSYKCRKSKYTKRIVCLTETFYGDAYSMKNFWGRNHHDPAPIHLKSVEETIKDWERVGS